MWLYMGNDTPRFFTADFLLVSYVVAASRSIPRRSSLFHATIFFNSHFAFVNREQRCVCQRSLSALWRNPLAAVTQTYLFRPLRGSQNTQVGVRSWQVVEWTSRGRIAVESKSNRSFNHRITHVSTAWSHESDYNVTVWSTTCVCFIRGHLLNLNELSW